MRGLSIADGTSVLLQFAGFLEVASFIQVAYLEYRGIQQSYLKVQLLNTDVDRSSCMSILSHCQMFCRRLNHQHRSEISSEKIRGKFEEEQTSKDREIFKMEERKLDKENYAKIIVTPEHEQLKTRK